MQLSKAVLSYGACSGESSGGLSGHNNSNMVCEAYRTDAPVKHIVDQDCQNMGKFSKSPQYVLVLLLLSFATLHFMTACVALGPQRSLSKSSPLLLGLSFRC